jgi:hypothetical protein
VGEGACTYNRVPRTIEKYSFPDRNRRRAGYVSTEAKDMDDLLGWKKKEPFWRISKATSRDATSPTSDPKVELDN